MGTVVHFCRKTGRCDDSLRLTGNRSGTGSALLPDRKLSGCDHLVIHDGDTFLLCRPDRRQEDMLAAWRKRVAQEGEYSDARSNPAMLRLSIKYE